MDEGHKASLSGKHTPPHWIFKLNFGVWVGRTDGNDRPELKVCTLFMTIREDCRRISLWYRKKKKRKIGRWGSVIIPCKLSLISKIPKLTSLVSLGFPPRLVSFNMLFGFLLLFLFFVVVFVLLFCFFFHFNPCFHVLLSLPLCGNTFQSRLIFYSSWEKCAIAPLRKNP